MWRAEWLLEPTTDAASVVLKKILVDQVRTFAVQASKMTDDESVSVDMLMCDEEITDSQVWEPVIVQGVEMTLNAAYNVHSFAGPITLRFRKTATIQAVGISDFEPDWE